jgi:peptide/nickel transport system permease protein
MASHILKRLVLGIFSVFGVLVLVFFLARLTGDPTNLYLPQNATKEARDAFRAVYHLDRPVLEQFGLYLQNLIHLDFGRSMLRQQPAMEVALLAFPNTLKIAVVALAIAVSAALVVGSLAAYRPSGVFDRLTSIFSLTGASAPDFWVAIVAVLVFSVGLHLLPTSGTGGFQYWIMPVAVLALRPFGLLVQVVRGAMIGSLSSAYVKTAQAKGVPVSGIIFKHALRNSMLPVITVAGDIAASIVNGAVVIETVFGWPGIGKLTIDAISQRDFPILQACVLVTAIAVFAINLLVDLLYAALDPRVRAA